MSKFKPLTLADYEKREEELKEYEVEISEDPSTQVEVFLAQLHKVNNYTQRVGTMELDAIKNEFYYKKKYEEAKMARDTKRNDVMNDPAKGIAKKSNQALRDAAASAFIVDEENALLNAIFEYERAKTHRILIQKRLERLADAGDKASRQITVVDYMIKLGLLRGVGDNT